MEFNETDSFSFDFSSSPNKVVVEGDRGDSDRSKKGIGFAMVKRMAELGVKVILTARDIERGHKAVETLRAQGLEYINFFCLDVSDPCSIKTLSSWFTQNFPALDILFLYENHHNVGCLVAASTKLNFGGQTWIPMMLPSPNTTNSWRKIYYLFPYTPILGDKGILVNGYRPTPLFHFDLN